MSAYNDVMSAYNDVMMRERRQISFIKFASEAECRSADTIQFSWTVQLSRVVPFIYVVGMRQAATVHSRRFAVLIMSSIRLPALTQLSVFHPVSANTKRFPRDSRSAISRKNFEALVTILFECRDYRVVAVAVYLLWRCKLVLKTKRLFFFKEK